jgi:hypothetical protein
MLLAKLFAVDAIDEPSMGRVPVVVLVHLLLLLPVRHPLLVGVVAVADPPQLSD